MLLRLQSCSFAEGTCCMQGLQMVQQGMQGLPPGVSAAGYHHPGLHGAEQGLQSLPPGSMSLGNMTAAMHQVGRPSLRIYTSCAVVHAAAVLAAPERCRAC